MELKAEAIFAGEGTGDLLRLRAPLSFWGGIDQETGRISNVTHPDHNASIAGKVLAIPRMIGSSSSSSIMLELIRNGCAPAAIVVGEVDAILVVGCLVARELGMVAPPVLRMDVEAIARLPDGMLRAVAGTDGVAGISRAAPSG